jgi:hypothetical protein
LGLGGYSQGQECNKKEAHEAYISAGFGVGRDMLPLAGSICLLCNGLGGLGLDRELCGGLRLVPGVLLVALT